MHGCHWRNLKLRPTNVFFSQTPAHLKIRVLSCHVQLIGSMTLFRQIILVVLSFVSIKEEYMKYTQFNITRTNYWKRRYKILQNTSLYQGKNKLFTTLNTLPVVKHTHGIHMLPPCPMGGWYETSNLLHFLWNTTNLVLMGRCIRSRYINSSPCKTELILLTKIRLGLYKKNQGGIEIQQR